MKSYFEAQDIVWDKARYEKELQNGFVRIAEIDGERVGFYHLGEKETHVHIHTIQIDAAKRNLGIGSQVMHQIEKDVLKMGKDKIQLNVFEANPAKKLYLRLGYQVEEKSGSKFLMSKEI